MSALGYGLQKFPRRFGLGLSAQNGGFVGLTLRAFQLRERCLRCDFHCFLVFGCEVKREV